MGVYWLSTSYTIFGLQVEDDGWPRKKSIIRISAEDYSYAVAA